MTILDHRILIPKSPEKIWEFLGDLSQNSAWQVDCTSVSILTPNRSGAGVRWRYTTKSGRSYVAEITAWYVGLGYEYTFIDGTPFSESKGRIRLQEIAEGTVVQWTLTYETGGMLAGVRNAGVKRQFETPMVDSLKNLWKVLQKVMPEDRPREVKSLMRDAPDYESRTHYRPRHPSTKQDDQYQPETAADGISSIVEPPIAADDTRPRAPVSVVAGDSASQTDDQAFQPESAPKSEPTAETVSEIQIPEPIPEQVTTPTILDEETVAENNSPVIPTSVRTVTQETSAVATETAFPASSAVDNTEDAPDVSSDATVPYPPDTVKMATGEMSVFDLFGLPRPSQTQEMNRVVIPEPTIETAESSVVSIEPTRMGLRFILRRKRITIRRPV